MSVLLRIGFIAGDLIFLNLSIAFSYVLMNVRLVGDERVNSIYLFVFSNLAWLFLIVVSNPYNFPRTWGISKVFKSQSSFIFIHLLVVASLIFFFKKNYSLTQIGVMYILFFPTFFLWKTSLLYVSGLLSRRNTDTKNVIILGKGELVREVRKYFLVHKELKYRFLGLFENTSEGIPMREIQEFCHEKRVDEIYCCLPGITNADLKRLIDYGLDTLIRVKMVTDRPFRQKPLELENYDQVPVVSLTTVPLDDTRYQFLKRVFDFVFSLAVTILILSWLLPILAIAIKLDSKGPVFFRQRRTGMNNRTFQCIKFRTMTMNAEADTLQATLHDSRVTQLGSLLRRSSLDEFPQFFNVLSGEMSLIGPRPHPVKLNEKFHPDLERLMSRHYVKPGITGLAQSMGYRGETRNLEDMRNRIRLDRFYIENWSFLLDLKIIILTINSLVRGSEKAY